MGTTHLQMMSQQGAALLRDVADERCKSEAQRSVEGHIWAQQLLLRTCHARAQSVLHSDIVGAADHWASHQLPHELIQQSSEAVGVKRTCCEGMIARRLWSITSHHIT